MSSSESSKGKIAPEITDDRSVDITFKNIKYSVKTKAG